jgi:hypothetical protein
MNSVNQDQVGTASGVDNAVARVAGVLAIAVLGIVMVSAFAIRLDHGLAHLPLPPGVHQWLQADKIKLAGLQPPAGLNPTMNTAVKEAIGEAFCIWIPNCNVDLRWPVSGQCGCRIAYDSERTVIAFARAGEHLL